MGNMPSRGLEPPAKIRIIFDSDREPRIYVNDMPVLGGPCVEVLTDTWLSHGNPRVQLTFRNPEIEIQHVDPNARLDLRGRPDLIDGLPPMRRHAEQAAERIRAHVAEDQRIADATTPVPLAGQWRAAQDKHAADDAPLSLVQGRDQHDRDPDCIGYSYGNPVVVYAAEWQHEAEANLRHIVRHDPAHVLARSATLLDVLAALEKIAERSTHPDPREWARLAICELARAWELDDEE